MRKLIERLYVETGSEEKIGEPQLTIYKRVKVMSWACSLGHEGCINYSINAFSQWLSVSNPDKENP
jgi:aminopeptidase N